MDERWVKGLVHHITTPQSLVSFLRLLINILPWVPVILRGSVVGVTARYPRFLNSIIMLQHARRLLDAPLHIQRHEATEQNPKCGSASCFHHFICSKKITHNARLEFHCFERWLQKIFRLPQILHIFFSCGFNYKSCLFHCFIGFTSKVKQCTNANRATWAGVVFVSVVKTAAASSSSSSIV